MPKMRIPAAILASVLVSDFDYHLPEELIAQQPAADRSGSRMLVLDRARQEMADRHFRDIVQYLRSRRLPRTRIIPKSSHPGCLAFGRAGRRALKSS